MHKNIFNCDMHMHLDLSKDVDKTIQYIENRKSYTLAVTNLPDLYVKSNKKYKNLKYVRFALGFHPELIYRYSNQFEIFKREIKLSRYIGEIGLDKTDINNYEIQKTFFEAIIKECEKYDNKILSIHSRKSVDDILNLIKKSFSSKIIMHWFTGNKTQLQECIDRGYYFSINVKMILSEKGKSLIAKIPDDRILIESDFPFSETKEEYDIDFIEKIIKYLSINREKSEMEISNIIRNNLEKLLE